MIFAKHFDTTSLISYLHDQDTKVDTKVYWRHFHVLDVIETLFDDHLNERRSRVLSQGFYHDVVGHFHDLRSRVDLTSILIVDIQYQSVQRYIHANIEYLRSYLRLRIGRLSHWRELRYDKYRYASKNAETRKISPTNFSSSVVFFRKSSTLSICLWTSTSNTKMKSNFIFYFAKRTSFLLVHFPGVYMMR